MKKSIIIILVLLFSLVSYSLTAAGEIPFVQELAYQLEERNWNEEEIEAFVEQSRKLSWNGIHDADAEVVAFALSYAKERSVESDMEEQLLQAHMALELARSSQEMRQLGFSSQSMAESAVSGVRDSLNQIAQQRTQESQVPEHVQLMIEKNLHMHIQKDMAFRTRDENSQGRKPMAQPDRAGGPSGPPNLPASAGRK